MHHSSLSYYKGQNFLKTIPSVSLSLSLSLSQKPDTLSVVSQLRQSQFVPQTPGGSPKWVFSKISGTKQLRDLPPFLASAGGGI